MMLRFTQNILPIRFVLVLLFSCSVFVHATYAQSLTNKLDRYVQERLDKSSIPGLAIAVVHNDTLLFSKGYGKTSANVPVTSNTPFAIASLSKAFTAMAIMQLVEAGRISLDVPVVQYVPSFSTEDNRAKSITVRQLLHQTSGLADTGFPELAFRQQPATLDEAMARFNVARLVSEPGQQYHYHNPNYRLLAKIVEAVSHEPFAGYLQKHIFQPLHMTHTSDVSTTKSFYIGSDKIDHGHIFFLGKPVAVREPDWFIDGAAGMHSTVNDMGHWLSLQLAHGRVGDTQLLSRESMTLMHNPLPNISLHYGMGWIVRSDSSLYHSGILWTYSAEQILLTKDGYGVVMLFNSGINPYVDYNSFLRGVTDILAGQEPEIPTLPDWILPIGVGLILLLFIGLAIRRFFRINQWFQTYQQRPVWRSWFFLLVRLLPFVTFLLIPTLLTAISGRVLNWERIFLMMPDGVIGFGLIALLNLAIAVTRLVQIFRSKRTANVSL
ncbi:beta-lactamase family protein [Spirosoma sp. BT702]|uniref:Beta-lactamase family protein n=1 Tax=Spirosoma profusum TaxID=2771354 RepID=A0A926XWZ4_9BACT|nr:serine hydrolase domain-containing protein [Spirosoma profusum]MBD2702338.1 beta-lactamase family protein [Spirosoma profusum]